MSRYDKFPPSVPREYLDLSNAYKEDIASPNLRYDCISQTYLSTDIYGFRARDICSSNVSSSHWIVAIGMSSSVSLVKLY